MARRSLSYPPPFKDRTNLRYSALLELDLPLDIMAACAETSEKGEAPSPSTYPLAENHDRGSCDDPNGSTFAEDCDDDHCCLRPLADPINGSTLDCTGLQYPRYSPHNLTLIPSSTEFDDLGSPSHVSRTHENNHPHCHSHASLLLSTIIDDVPIEGDGSLGRANDLCMAYMHAINPTHSNRSLSSPFCIDVVDRSVFHPACCRHEGSISALHYHGTAGSVAYPKISPACDTQDYFIHFPDENQGLHSNYEPALHGQHGHQGHIASHDEVTTLPEDLGHKHDIPIETVAKYTYDEPKGRNADELYGSLLPDGNGTHADGMPTGSARCHAKDCAMPNSSDRCHAKDCAMPNSSDRCHAKDDQKDNVHLNDEKFNDKVVNTYENQGKEHEDHGISHSEHELRQPLIPVPVATHPKSEESLGFESTEVEEKIIYVKDEKAGFSSSGGLQFKSLRGYQSQEYGKSFDALSHTPSPSLRSGVKQNDSTNLQRWLANASFSAYSTLPSSKMFATKNLPTLLAKMANSSSTLSSKAPCSTLTPKQGKLASVSSFPRPSSNKPSSQSQKAAVLVKNAVSTSTRKPPIKPANTNVSSPLGNACPRAPTSAPTSSRLVALPQVNVKAREEVRLDLRGQKVKSLDCYLVNLTAKLEFVYLRDNKLSHLAGIEILRRVKVLDLSLNEFKGPGMEPLASCKSLQQLYLAGNQITSLTSLPQLPNLEFLSIAQNKLRDLVMVSQPKLKVLAASKNRIATFKGFPHFPCLEHLRLEENPITDMKHVEVAAILLAGPDLKRFNNLDLTLEEQELACMYPPHVSLCIRDGWQFCDVTTASGSSLTFLLEKWADRVPPGYNLEQAYVEQPFEDYPCRCHFVFKKQNLKPKGLGLTFHYQWFIGGRTPTDFVLIEGAVKEVYWPNYGDIGHCLKVECVSYLGDVEYAPIFAISFPVLPGTGCPKVINLSVDGELKEGNIIRGNVEVAWCGGTPTKGIVSWLRHDESCSPRMVPGAEELDYLLALDDVGAKLILMYTPVTQEGIKGEPCFATTDVIQAGFPSVSNIRVLGDLVEGKTIKGVGTYFGGREGLSKFEWLTEDITSGAFRVVLEGSADLTLSDKEVDLRIMFRYTPVDSKGHEGIPISIVTERVSYAPPKVTSLAIVGDLCEGGTARVSAIISGRGTEGVSRVRWLKTRALNQHRAPANMEEIGSSTASEGFCIPLDAVGFYLAAEYTPVLLDGVVGKQAVAISDVPINMLLPCLTSLSMTGEHIEGGTLMMSYSYIGGKEGKSQYTWYLHKDESDPGSPIAEAAGCLTYYVTKGAIGRLVSFKCTPVREDGYVGEERSVMGQSFVKPGYPKVDVLNIVGEPMEGSHLRIEKSYWGGLEGKSTIQWFQVSSSGNLEKIPEATSHSYKIRMDDVDRLLCVLYKPCRSDGTTGAVKISQPVGPVMPAPPTCEGLRLVGEAIEGGVLNFTALYKGGSKGSCTCQWIRETADGQEKKLGIRDSLKLTVEDVGCRIKLVYTPVRKDGVMGIPQNVVSDIVIDGDPIGVSLNVPDGCEDTELVPQRSYFGGVEGDSEFTWFRLNERLEGSFDFTKAEMVGKTERYTPGLEDVGLYLALLWIPVRRDGKKGKPYLSCGSHKVTAAPPLVHKVTVRKLSPNVFEGQWVYHGGLEGESQMQWYRQAADGVMFPIAGASSKIYTLRDDDYTCSLVFGFTPVRQDGVVGQLSLSKPTMKIMPEVPKVEKLHLSGKAVEGGLLVVKEMIPDEEPQQVVWRKYIKDVHYLWSRQLALGPPESLEKLSAHRSCSYPIRTEDIGYFIQCECIIDDIFGRSSPPASVISSPVVPGLPKVTRLEIEGKGYHTSTYVIRGIYTGGREGRSVIRWFRAMMRRPDLVPIIPTAGEISWTYDANVEDVGYRLVAVYTPVREDGVEGEPVSVSTDALSVEPAIDREVKEKLESGTLRFEALVSRSPLSNQLKHQRSQSFEKRIIDVNKRRLKVMKSGTPKTFLGSDVRYTFPSHVEADRTDQHRLKITIDNHNEMELMVQSRHLRDVVVLVIKSLISEAVQDHYGSPGPH